MPFLLSTFLEEHPFVKYDEISSLAGVYGIFLLIGCEPGIDGNIECYLLDFGGAVDVKHAIETSFATHNWRDTCHDTINIMVAKVSILECEILLRKLHTLYHKNGKGRMSSELS
jgi:hypothetical protein